MGMTTSKNEAQLKPDFDENEIPEWQKLEFLSRLNDLKEHPESGID